MAQKSIRKSILLNNLITISIPLVLFVYFTLRFLMVRYEEEIVTRNQIITMNLAERFDIILEEPIRITAYIYEAYGSHHSHEDASTTQALVGIVGSNPSILNIELLDSEGSVIQSAVRPQDIGINRSGEDFYTQLAQMDRDYYWSPPYISTAIGDLSYSLAYHTPNDQYILIYSSLKSLSESALSYAGQFGSDVHVAITDKTGRYISHEDLQKVYIRMVDSNIEAIRDVANGNASHRIVPINDVDYVINATMMPTSQWYVVVYQPTESVFGLLNTLLLIMIGMVIFSAAITTVHTFVFSGRIHDFITKMKTAMDLAITNDFQTEADDFRYNDLNEVNDRFIHLMNEVKDRDAQLLQIAYYDQLTGLGNRLLMNEDIPEMIGAAKDQSVTFALLNMDNFKIINDIYGHNIGDELICFTANQLRSITDKLNSRVYYLGADEFALVIPLALNEDALSEMLLPLFEQMRQGLYINRHFLRISVTVGVANYPEQTSNSKELYQFADIALIEGKNTHKGTISVFNQQMRQQIQNRSNMNHLLRTALDQGMFELFFQPQIDARTKEIYGFEALIRLRKNNGDLVPPNLFIPVAENTGLILELGAWIAKEAIDKALSINQRFGANYHMGINISTVQMGASGFIESIMDTITNSGIDLSMIELEITESVFINDESTAFNALQTLSQAGVNFSLDDFGTGYSSLSYLTSMPFSTLKVDRMFIADMEFTPTKKDMLESIISMGHKLNMTIVAEGVESEEQLMICRKFGVDIIQGYYYSKPLPFDQLIDYIEHYSQQ